MSDYYEEIEESTPIWAVFGDLMSGVVGVFVLLLVWALGFQLELAQSLEEETRQREAEQQRRMALEAALSDPLAQGRITLDNGRIGISGSVLFTSGSAQLQEEGRSLLESLVAPLVVYLEDREQVLMVSGFTDDKPVKSSNRYYRDNWELSAQRALTVTRALIEAGMAEDRIFAAAFGEQQPVTANTDAASRARNRRVEMAPVPRNPVQRGASDS